MKETPDYRIEYSAGDEAYTEALAGYLPVSLPAQPAATLPLTVDGLRAARESILNALADMLALPAPTPRMSQTFDGFIATYTALQSFNLLPRATRFALWRKSELAARLAAGQSVENFHRAADGGIEYSLNVNFEFGEGQEPKDSIAALRTDMARLTWPLKIGELADATPDTEIQQRLGELRQNLAELGSFQSAQLQRLGVITVLHETVESTLVDSYIRSPDRRWFCEGVANYLAYHVVAQLAGAEVARGYYDVDAEVAKYAAARDRADLAHWPVAEDPKSRDVPAEVNTASYAFAVKATFDAFPEPKLLTAVLKDLGKTPVQKADMATVKAAYRQQTGKDLRP